MGENINYSTWNIYDCRSVYLFISTFTFGSSVQRNAV